MPRMSRSSISNGEPGRVNSAWASVKESAGNFLLDTLCLFRIAICAQPSMRLVHDDFRLSQVSSSRPLAKQSRGLRENPDCFVAIAPRNDDVFRPITISRFYFITGRGSFQEMVMPPSITMVCPVI
jgi:hypothetical protein